MLKITVGNYHIELTTGTRYELETVPKYFLKFSDNVIATVYRSGIVKSIGDVDFATARTLGGMLVSLQTDIRTGGYITLTPKAEHVERFRSSLQDLTAIRNALAGGSQMLIQRLDQLEYELDVPTDEEIVAFFARIKGQPELDALADRLNRQLGLMDIIHPSIGDLDYLAFSVSLGCGGLCSGCSFQHLRKLTPRAEEEVHLQIDLYKQIFTPKERACFEIFAGNHRGLGMDFELFCTHIDMIRKAGGIRDGRVFTFCNAEDILRLNKQYGQKEMERRMLSIGLNPNFGVESGSLSGLSEYGKNNSLPAIRQALSLLKNTKIPYSVNILAGVEWENHTWETLKLFRSLYRPADNRPTVYSSDFIGANGRINLELATQQYTMLRESLNDCGIHVFRYTFVPFNHPSQDKVNSGQKNWKVK